MRSIREIMFTPKELDVILIQPNFLMKILKEEQNQIVREYWESMGNQEPLGDLPNEVNHGLFSLAASLRDEGFSVDVLDFQAYDLFLRENEHRMITLEDVEKIIQLNKAKIFGISTITVASENALSIAKTVKRIHKDALMLFGGMHPTLVPDEFIQNPEVDVIILGEGNETIVEIAKQWKERTLPLNVEGIVYKIEDSIVFTNKKSNYHINLDDISYPAYDLMCRESLPFMPRFFTSRGCPYSCAFCSCDAFYRNAYEDYKIVYRDPQKVVDEIEYTYKQYGMNFYCFGDLTFMSNREHIYAICKELILRGLNHIPWWCQTTVGSLNEDDLKLMKQAGCRQIGLGVENGVQENLDIMGKPIKFDKAEEQCRMIREAGIEPITYWIIGLGDATLEDAMRTIERICYFVKNNLTEVSHIGVPVPYPGSPIGKNPTAFGLQIVKRNYSEYWMNSDELGYSKPAIRTDNLSEDHIYALWQYALMVVAKEYQKRKIKN